MEPLEIKGNLVDIVNETIFPGVITVENGFIRNISKRENISGPFIIPGFIDAHVHIESSMLVPSEFARMAVVHGTVATVSDPHEIANVLGVEGVEYMTQDLEGVNFKCYFGAPSCVPATAFETSGAAITSKQIDYLLSKPEIHYLAEMMNWPGVLSREPEVMAKIQKAVQYKKPIDGHAPGLRGEDVINYISAGMSTDHECSTLEEALDKLAQGMKILIREGITARNFDALLPLLPEYADKVRFCSDDLHPDNLVEGHINLLVQRAVANGLDPLLVLRSASKNPVDHYNLDVGLLQEGDPADFILVKDLIDFNVVASYINGRLTTENGKTLIPGKPSKRPNNFTISPRKLEEFQVKAAGNNLRVMVAHDGQLLTEETIESALIEDGLAISDPDRDILKITVINRYNEQPPVVGFVKNFGIKSGAIASSVAHDSHNIIAVGVEDHHICQAVNTIIEHRGGVVAVSPKTVEMLPLPVAGLMSDIDGSSLAQKYIKVDTLAKAMGSKLRAPFMTLSFMALLVIPDLKIGDKGLFSGSDFNFVSLFTD